MDPLIALLMVTIGGRENGRREGILGQSKTAGYKQGRVTDKVDTKC